MRTCLKCLVSHAAELRIPFVNRVGVSRPVKMRFIMDIAFRHDLDIMPGAPPVVMPGQFSVDIKYIIISDEMCSIPSAFLSF